MSHFFAIAFLGMFMMLGMLSAATNEDEKPPTFMIITKRNDDTLEVRADKEKAVFIVKSPFGISQATIERTDEKWPSSVAIRLHLKGLESFRVTNGKDRIDAAVGIRDQKNEARVWKDGKEDMPLDSKSPYWIEIQMIGSDGKSAKEIPLKDGFFELRLPKMLFENNPKAITINWIDFYRN